MLWNFVRELWVLIIGAAIFGAVFAAVEGGARRRFSRDTRPYTRKSKALAIRRRVRLAPRKRLEWFALALAGLGLLLAFGTFVLEPPPGGSAINGEVRELRQHVESCCQGGSGEPLPPRAFGMTLRETAILFAFAFGITALGLYAFGSRKTAGALFAASTLFGLTGTQLLSLDKFLAPDSLLGFHFNTASMLASDDDAGPRETRPMLTIVDDEFLSFDTGRAVLPDKAQKPARLQSITPKLLLLVGRTDYRELRRAVLAEHGTNWTLAERRAQAVGNRFWPAFRRSSWPHLHVLFNHPAISRPIVP